MKNKLLFLIISINLVFFSCSKEKLDDEISKKFIGQWEWVRTENTRNSNSGFVTDLYNEQNYKEVVLEILEKGVLKIKIDGKCEHRHRIIRYSTKVGPNDEPSIFAGLKPSDPVTDLSLILFYEADNDSVLSATDPILFDLDVFDPSTIRSYFVRK